MASNVQRQINPVQFASWIECDSNTSHSEETLSLICPVPVRPDNSSSSLMNSFDSEKISLASAIRFGYFEIAFELVEQGSFSTDPAQLQQTLRLAALKNQTRLIQEIFKRTVVSQEIVDDLVILAASKNKQRLFSILKDYRITTGALLTAMKQAKLEACKWTLLKYFTPYMNHENISELMKVLQEKKANEALHYLESNRFLVASLQEKLKKAILEGHTEIVITILQVSELSQNVRDYLVILAAWKNKVDVLQELFKKPVSNLAIAIAILMIESIEIRDFLWKKIQDAKGFLPFKMLKV